MSSTVASSPPPPAALHQRRLHHDHHDRHGSLNPELSREARSHQGDRPSISTSVRLQCLDVLRGLTVCLMILVDFVGEGYSHLDHSPWNGFCLADIVMPAFLFMVGVSVPLALRKYARPSRQHKDQNHKQSVAKAWAKVGTRTIKLFGIGVLTQGAHLPRPGRPVFSGYDLKTVRWMGILQRIAISYFIVGALEIVANALDATLAKQTRSKDNRHHDDNAAKTQAQDAHPIGIDDDDIQKSKPEPWRSASDEKNDESQALLVVLESDNDDGHAHSNRLSESSQASRRPPSLFLSSLFAFRFNCFLHLSAIAVLTLVPVVIGLSFSPSSYTFEHPSNNGTVLTQVVDCSSHHYHHHRYGNAKMQMGGGASAWFAPDPECNMYREVDAKILGGIQHLYKSPEYRRLPACSDCSPSLCDPSRDGRSSPTWCAAPFDPEGFLSSISASATACVGALFAIAMMAAIKREKFSRNAIMIHCRYQADRISQDALLHLHLLPIPLNAKTSSSTQPLLLLSSWLFVSIVLLIVPGLVLHWCDVFPLNKNIWSVSYFLFTTGVSGTVLAVLYGVIDGPWRIRAVGVIMQPFRWVGLNAILVYLGAATDLLDSALSCFFFGDPKNNLYNMMYSAMCSHAGESQPPLLHRCHAGIMAGVQAKVALLVITLFRILFWIVVAGVLHWKKWYWAL